MKEREKSELGQSRGPAKAGPPRKRSGPPAPRSVTAKSEAIVRQVNPDFVAGGLIGPIMQKAPMVAAIMLSAIVFFTDCDARTGHTILVICALVFRSRVRMEVRNGNRMRRCLLKLPPHLQPSSRVVGHVVAPLSLFRSVRHQTIHLRKQTNLRG